jgi:uncharacterized protein (DUF697 family)
MPKSPKKPTKPRSTPAKPRARRKRPSFDLPAAAAGPELGWVYRSDVPEARAPEPIVLTDTSTDAIHPVTGADSPAAWIVKKHAMMTAGAGLVPVPLVDVAAIATLQVRMVSELAKHYDLPMNRESGKTAVAALVGSLAPLAVAPGLCSLFLRRVPVFGTVFCLFTVSASASAATYAIGHLFIRHFENGGTVDDFDATAAQQELHAQLTA